MRNFLYEFKEFVNRGNVVDLAVGLAIGTAFGKIVSSLVNDVIFPVLAPVMQAGDFNTWQVNGVMIGNFLKALVDFVIIALAIFLVVKIMNKFRKKTEAKPAEPTPEVRLLTEIRDLLKK